ncbi:MAG: YARHG domain-containing protein, partial [Flavobacteriaceae bacterium]
MKHSILILLIVALFSCKKSKNIEVSNVLEEKEVYSNVEPKKSVLILENSFNFENFKGSYVGLFLSHQYGKGNKPSYANKINITLDSVEVQSKTLYGHSVVAGNSRPFKGAYTYDSENNSIDVNAKEPGDDKYDGFFTFNCLSTNSMNGFWIANDKNLAVIGRKYNLDKLIYTYNKNTTIKVEELLPLYNSSTHEESGKKEAATNDISKYNASNTKLTYKDVENLKKGDLEIIRNTIYARHGYSFKNRKMRYFFDSYVDWYIPVTTDIRAVLTPLEKENIELLKRYEKHAS